VVHGHHNRRLRLFGQIDLCLSKHGVV
jgi:hypothetical protein